MRYVYTGTVTLSMPIFLELLGYATMFDLPFLAMLHREYLENLLPANGTGSGWLVGWLVGW